MESHSTECWERRIEDASTDRTTIFRLCRQLTNAATPIRPLLDEDGSLSYRAEERAEIFAKHLEQQFQPNLDTAPDHTAEVNQRLAEFFAATIAPDEDPIVITPGMVQRTIAKTKPKKAPGVDGIDNKAVRHLPRSTVAAVTRLFNGILRTGQFPDVWKTGIVIMIPKPGKNILKPGSYRPITLLPSISKVFERLLLRHLAQHIELRHEKFGFRAEHSTTLQLSRVLHKLTVTINKKEKAVAVFLDVEKAFDRVWHPGFVYKLTSTAAPRCLVRVISSFLEDRSFKVKIEQSTSNLYQIAAGVPQGSCLSPTLYALYTNDIPNTEATTLALYADDAAYIATSIRTSHAIAKMQRTPDALPDWLSKWRLSINVDKTQALSVGTRLTVPSLRLEGKLIRWHDTVKYLGVTIDRRLNMGAHTKITIAKTKTTMAALRPMLTSSLPLRVKLNLYKIYVRSRLTYASPAWFALLSETNKKKLQVQQSKALRYLAKAPWYVRNSTLQRDLKIESLEDFAVKLSKAMFARADASNAPHIKNITPWNSRPPDGRALPRSLITPRNVVSS